MRRVVVGVVGERRLVRHLGAAALIPSVAVQKRVFPERRLVVLARREPIARKRLALVVVALVVERSRPQAVVIGVARLVAMRVGDVVRLGVPLRLRGRGRVAGGLEEDRPRRGQRTGDVRRAFVEYSRARFVSREKCCRFPRERWIFGAAAVERLTMALNTIPRLVARLRNKTLFSKYSFRRFLGKLPASLALGWEAFSTRNGITGEPIGCVIRRNLSKTDWKTV